MTSVESSYTKRHLTPSSMAIQSPWRHTSYSATLLEAGKCIRRTYSENVSELILGQHNKHNARTSIIDIEGAIEVHHPVLGAGGGDGLLDLGPLNDEISKRLRLDGRPASEFNGVCVELDRPLDDTAIGLFVVEDVP